MADIPATCATPSHLMPSQKSFYFICGRLGGDTLRVSPPAYRILTPFHCVVLPKVYNHGAAQAQAQHAFQLLYSLQRQEKQCILQSIKPASNSSGWSLYI